MADDIPQTRQQRQRQAYQDSLRRADDFWQRAVNEGRIIRQAEAQTQQQTETSKQTQQQRPRQQRI